MVQFACKQACMLCISRDHAKCTLPQRSKNRLNHHCRTAQARAPIKIRGIKTLINCNNPIRASYSTHALGAEMKVLTASQPKAKMICKEWVQTQRVCVFFPFYHECQSFGWNWRRPMKVVPNQAWEYSQPQVVDDEPKDVHSQRVKGHPLRRTMKGQASCERKKKKRACLHIADPVHLNVYIRVGAVLGLPALV